MASHIIKFHQNKATSVQLCIVHSCSCTTRTALGNYSRDPMAGSTFLQFFIIWPFAKGFLLENVAHVSCCVHRD